MQRRLARENMILKEELAQRRGAPQIVGDDAKLKQVSVALHRAAATDTTVLLEGESGHWQRAVRARAARAEPAQRRSVHRHQLRGHPRNLLETELFGYEKGAFTGAANRKPGKVRARAPRDAVSRAKSAISAAGAAGEDPARARREAVRERRRHGTYRCRWTCASWPRRTAS